MSHAPTAKADERPHPGMVVHREGSPEDRKNGESVFGFWIFMMSDAVIFALLFATYLAQRSGIASAPSAAQVLSLGNAFIETLVLLASS